MTYLGFDTSNYTTSIAIFDGEKITQKKQVLSVKEGEKGLRQSDALFQHTLNLPKLIDDFQFDEITAVSSSVRPRNVENSYMPCFLVGKNAGIIVAKTNNAPFFETSHQVGHVLASLYSTKRLDLINEKFIAFHLSGGTSEALLVEKDDENIIKTTVIAKTLDLNAGQAIDRAGVMLNMRFPCGKELDALAQKSDKQFKIKTSMKGADCSISGVENKVKKMIDDGEKAEDIAKFTLEFISATVIKMIDEIILDYGNLPIVFSGGVSSNSLLRKNVLKRYDAYFAEPEYSLDNAAGVAIFAYLKSKK